MVNPLPESAAEDRYSTRQIRPVGFAWFTHLKAYTQGVTGVVRSGRLTTLYKEVITRLFRCRARDRVSFSSPIEMLAR